MANPFSLMNPLNAIGSDMDESTVSQLPVKPRNFATLAPRNMAEAIQFSQILAKSDFVPREYRGKPENIFSAVQLGMELGVQPLQALQGIAVINGKPSVYGDLALAIVRNHPEFETIEETVDENGATCRIKRRGEPLVTRTFTMAEAKQARLWGKEGPWTFYPQRMLAMRARGFALRDCFADALKGLITREEAEDYPVEKDITPPKQDKLPGVATPDVAKTASVMDMPNDDPFAAPQPNSTAPKKNGNGNGGRLSDSERADILIAFDSATTVEELISIRNAALKRSKETGDKASYEQFERVYRDIKSKWLGRPDDLGGQP